MERFFPRGPYWTWCPPYANPWGIRHSLLHWQLLCKYQASLPMGLHGLTARVACYWAFLGLSALLFCGPLSELTSLAIEDDRYSYTIFIPFITTGLIWLRRLRIFSISSPCPQMGIPLLALGVLLYYLPAAHPPGALWLPVASIVVTWIAGFLLFFGLASLRAAMFPLLLLWLLVPVPSPHMKFIEVALQNASAEMAYALFQLTGMPVFRQGLTFSLPGVDVQVAEECSGIRSSLSLLIVTLVASQLFLKSGWRQLCLALLAIPIVIFKNAVRITTLSWLGVYVSPSYFYGDLHRYGGLPFSLLVFALLIPVLVALQNSERRSAGKLPLPPK